MPYKDPEKARANARKNYEKRKDEYNRRRREKYANDESYRLKRKIADKKHYDKKTNNPNYFKELYAKNKDRDKEYKKKYHLNIWVNSRQKKGVKFHINPIEYKHKIYDTTKNCDFCHCEFKPNMKKCVEHHHPSGYIRGICCHKCNMELSVVDKNLSYVLLELHRYFNTIF